MENIKISQTQIFICYHCRLCCCSKMEIHWKNNCGVGHPIIDYSRRETLSSKLTLSFETFFLLFITSFHWCYLFNENEICFL